MGERALGFLNGVKFPLSRELGTTEGELQTFTPTIDAFFTPDIDDSLDDQPAKTRFWNAFKLLGEWWASLRRTKPSARLRLCRRRRRRPRVVPRRAAPPASALWPAILLVAILIIPGTLAPGADRAAALGPGPGCSEQ